jgi:small GTP-binding protein
MLQKLLTADQQRVLSAERRALRELERVLDRAGAGRDDLDSLGDSLAQLDRLFLIVIVGEFNSGKSTFINALLGMKVLEEGVTPTTHRIHRLIWGEGPETSIGGDDIIEVQAPARILEQLEIVDTPGTNALDREHEALTERFVPRSDLVLFVTSVDRPFTESERAFIERIREWGKKLVLIVNKIDFLETEDDLGKVMDFVRASCARILELVPEIFPVSARKALESKLDDDPEVAVDTSDGVESDGVSGDGFDGLERYLMKTLDDAERVRLKLLNPLGVGERLASRCLTRVDERLELLREDVRNLEEIDRQLELFGSDMRSEFRFRLTDVDNELHAFEKRGLEFFDDTVRLGRAFDLVNKERIQADYQRRVIGDTPKRLEQKVDEIVDWMVAAELTQWQAMMRLLERRRHADSNGFGGTLGAFDRTRRELLDTVGRAAQESLASFDERAEAQRLANSVQTAVAGTALLEVGAVGLGTVFTLLASTQMADFTGILAASTLAVVGLLVLPARKRKAKADFGRKILRLRRRLLDTLTEAFEHETERSIANVRESVAPYTRFVRSRREELDELRNDLGDVQARLTQLRTEITAL